MTGSFALFAISSLPFLILGAAYFYMWQGKRRIDTWFWGAGWIVYALRTLAPAGEQSELYSDAGRFVGLLSLGLCSFLLWAGARAFVHNPATRRFYLAVPLMLLCSLLLFAPWPSVSALATAPVLVLSLLFDGGAVVVLARYSLMVERRRLHWLIGLTYIPWGILKVIHFLIPVDAPSFAPWLIVVNGLALALSFSLIGLSLIEAERHARRRTERLSALAALTTIADRPFTPHDLLQAALDEIRRLLEVSGEIGAFLIEDPAMPVQMVARRNSCLLGEDLCLSEACPCDDSIRTGQLACLENSSASGSCAVNLVIPLRAGTQTLGVICAEMGPDFTLSAGERRTFETLGRQLGKALENARLLREMGEEIERLQVLIEASRKMSAELDLEKALEGIVAAGMEIVAADRAAVYLFDAERDRVDVSYARGLSQDYLDFLIDAFRNVPGYRVLQSPDLIWVRDAWHDAEAEPLREAARKEGFRSYLVLPLVYLQQVRGALVFYHDEPRLYNDRDLQLCQALAGQAAAVLENALLHRETRRRLEELAALHEIDLQMSSALELDQVLKIITEQLTRVLGVSSLYIGLYDAEANELDMRIVLDQGVFQTPLRFAVVEGESLSDLVIRTTEPLWINDVRQEMSQLPTKVLRVGGETRSLGILPLLIKGDVRGVLSVQSYEPNAFSASDRRLLAEIATQAAIAIENARLYQAERKARELSDSLLEIAGAVNSTLELNDVLKEVALRAARACSASRCTIFLLNHSGEMLEPIMSQFASGRTDSVLWRQLREVSSPHRVQDIPEAIRIIESHQPLYVPDVRASTLPPQWVEPFGVGSVLIVPLISRGERVIGVMAFDRVAREREFSTDQVTLATTIAGQAAVAIEKARLYQETARRLAQTQVLREVMLAAASTLDFDRVLQRTINALQATMRIEFICFVFPDDNGQSLQLHPAQVGFPEQPEDFRLPLEGSICGYVYRTGQPFVTGDVSQTPFYFEGNAHVRSEIAIPVRVGGRVIGVLNVESGRNDAFDEEDLSLFMALGGQLAVALENARLYQETARRLAEAQILREISQAAASTLDFDQILVRTIEALHRMLGVEYINLMTPDPTGQVMRPHRATLGFRDVLSGWEAPVDGCITGRVFRTGQPVIVADVSQEPDYAMGAEPVRSELAVPVRVGGEVVAVLNVESRHLNGFDESDLAFYTTVAGQLGVALENTRLYQQEQQRRREAEALTLQLEEQSTKLAKALQELQELDRLRNEMIQNVGHELRTPLTLIQGYIELLISGDMGPLEHTQRNALEIIYERAVVLSRLLRNLMALRSLPREKLSLSPLSLRRTVTHAADMYRRASERAGIQLVLDFPQDLPLIQGDEEHLQLVFLQLLDNAIKFSPDGGQIDIEVRANEQSVTVSIRDQGIGISPEHIGRLFERFYQVDGSTTRRFGGMGIGLAVVWEIVEIHGGQVTVQSEPGKGSTFTVSLPRLKE